MSKFDPTTAKRPELVTYLQTHGAYAGLSREGVDVLRAKAVEVHAAKSTPAKAKAEKAPKADTTLHTHCTNCGYQFPSPRASGRCKTEAACNRRKETGDPTVTRGRKASTSGNGEPAKPATERMARVQQAKAEKAAIDAWKAGGRKGQPPATPALDELNGKPTVRQPASESDAA